MKANTQYSDLLGTAAADISDLTTRSNTLEEMASFFNLDEKRFKIVGLSIYGIDTPWISFICEDLFKSTEDKKHIVKLSLDIERNDLMSLVLKRLHVVLYNKRDTVYPAIDEWEELSLSDFVNDDE